MRFCLKICTLNNSKFSDEFLSSWYKCVPIFIFNIINIFTINTSLYEQMPVAVYDGCGIVAFVYWLRLKQYLYFP